MDDLLVDVAHLRRLVREQKELEADYLERLEQTPEWNMLRSIRDDLKSLQEQLRSSEDALRQAIVEQYDGNKKGNGWGIRVMKRVRYDLKEATDWCRQNFHAALVLDTKLFERVARDIEAPVQIEEQITATIDSDLSAWEA